MTLRKAALIMKAVKNGGDPMSGPLSGVKVVELSTFVAAPVCARLLADLGAEVVKVERPVGDDWRRTSVSYIPSRFSDEENPVFDIYNSGKKHIAINLKDAAGMEVFHKLLSQADVLVTNTRPAALERLHLTYDELKQKYPSLIYAMVLGYGEKGPDAGKPAFDTVAFWSRSGYIRDLAVDGEHYTPVVPPYGVGDTVTGMFLMGEICAALYNRQKTGKGELVRTSLYHNGIFTSGNMQIITQPPFGRKFPIKREDNGVPGGYYQCADGEWVFVASVYAEESVPKMCKAIGRPELMEDPRFNTAGLRWKNRAEYYEIFRDAMLQKTSEEWLQIADELDIALNKIVHFSEVANDEQAWANGYLEHVTYPNGHIDVMPTSPIEMESVGQIKTKIAPNVGHDTGEILASLGYRPEEISQMRENGAIR